jgi:hypothetical protein
MRGAAVDMLQQRRAESKPARRWSAIRLGIFAGLTKRVT